MTTQTDSSMDYDFMHRIIRKQGVFLSGQGIENAGNGQDKNQEYNRLFHSFILTFETSKRMIFLLVPYYFHRYEDSNNRSAVNPSW